jgi:hypothetical protein
MLGPFMPGAALAFLLHVQKWHFTSFAATQHFGRFRAKRTMVGTGVENVGR